MIQNNLLQWNLVSDWIMNNVELGHGSFNLEVFVTIHDMPLLKYTGLHGLIWLTKLRSTIYLSTCLEPNERFYKNCRWMIRGDILLKTFEFYQGRRSCNIAWFYVL